MTQQYGGGSPPTAGQFPMAFQAPPAGPVNKAGWRSVEIDNQTGLTLTVLGDGQPIRVVAPYLSRSANNTTGAWQEVRIVNSGGAIGATDVLSVVLDTEIVTPFEASPISPIAWGRVQIGGGAVVIDAQGIRLYDPSGTLMVTMDSNGIQLLGTLQILQFRDAINNRVTNVSRTPTGLLLQTSSISLATVLSTIDMEDTAILLVPTTASGGVIGQLVMEAIGLFAGRLRVLDALAAPVLEIGLLGADQGKIGLHGAAPQAQATILGSRGGNAALANLLTTLAARGDIVDGTGP